MRIRGFNFVGEFDTKATADKDLVHTIYCMDNYALAAIIQDRRKTRGNPFYIVYGFNPRFGHYMSKWGPYLTYYACRDALEEMFSEQHPDILVNNHKADYISCLYGSYWTSEEQDEEAFNHHRTTYHLFNIDDAYFWHLSDNGWINNVRHNPEVETATYDFVTKMEEFKQALQCADFANRWDRITKAVEPEKRREQ